MKGLLKKDLYMAWAYCKVYLLLALVFLVFSFLASDNLFFMVYPMVIVSMLPVNMVSYDEKFKWTVYCDALPVSRKQVVSEKYLLSLLASGAVLLLMGGIRGTALLLQGQPAAFWNLLTILLVFGLVSPAVILPFILRLGPEKGRLVYYVIIAIFCAACIILMNRPLVTWTGFGSRPLDTLLVLLLSALIFVGSRLLAIRLYQKREL